MYSLCKRTIYLQYPVLSVIARVDSVDFNIFSLPIVHNASHLRQIVLESALVKEVGISWMKEDQWFGQECLRTSASCHDGKD